MTTNIQPQPPKIRSAGTTPRNPRKLFVNIPVSNIQRSIDFFEDLGFTFNTQFTDESAASMLVGADAYFMLLQTERFRGFTKRPLGDAKKETNALFAISVNSREEVDALVKKAVAIGGARAAEPQDHGFMYGWSFYDLDGHYWEVFWMDPSFVQN